MYIAVAALYTATGENITLWHESLAFAALTHQYTSASAVMADEGKCGGVARANCRVLHDSFDISFEFSLHHLSL